MRANATAATAKIRWHWALTEALNTRTGHHPNPPVATTQAKTTLARKNDSPKYGFQAR